MISISLEIEQVSITSWRRMEVRVGLNNRLFQAGCEEATAQRFRSVHAKGDMR